MGEVWRSLKEAYRGTEGGREEGLYPERKKEAEGGRIDAGVVLSLALWRRLAKVVAWPKKGGRGECGHAAGGRGDGCCCCACG